MTDPFILCDNLVKIYKVADLEVVALQGLDLAVAAGEMLGIIGASGSGKSTLLNIVGGLDRPSAGRITVDGRDLLKLSDRDLDRYRRAEVGFVWQQTGRNLIPYLTARENVELPMTVAGAGLLAKRRRSRELLEAVGLWEHRRHRLAQLSGGQQQRVAIAVALANRPRLLLADEPTGEVDSATAQGLLDLFRELNRAYGLTTVIVTHDPQIARQVDRVVAIRDGRTSTETIRRVSQLERAMAGERQEGEPEASEEAVDYHEYVVLDSAGRLQVPGEYLERFGIGDRATLEVTDEGILIRPVDGRSAAAPPSSAVAEEKEPPAAKQRGLRGWWPRGRKR
ncbi:MAG: ABC transporter ATP-binding protein [Anaerolineae bacterium]|nr:ABC transporter ATP-binding protein [Anaerolineae bacterium]MDX9832384.1 ABC transporter ATP-binding protein [Anaerolineae bacterium]